MTALTIGLGYFTQQHEFAKIIGFYAPLFVLYLVAYQLTSGHPQRTTFFIALAVLLRLLLVFSMPNLSDDMYRFIWDGRLLAQGYNPFDHLPTYYLENEVPVKGIDRALFEAFGAKDTYTSYPPVAQAQFVSACWLFPSNIYGCMVVMKSWLFFFEIGSILLIVKLLQRFQLPARNVLLYALNPLIIVEITGNLHFEGAMVFFLLLALWLLGDLTNFKNLKNRRANLRLAASAAAFALSICSKLLTLLFLPFFIKRMGRGRSLVYFAVTGAVTVLLFLPVVNLTFLQNFTASLGLYFSKLEYNASLYYLLRWAGYLVWGYNRIALFGPLLGAVAMIGIFWMAFRRAGALAGRGAAAELKALPEDWLFAFCLYLACTTTVHPWYLALPVVLCVFTKWRFPVVWSGLVFLTYVNYSYEPYRENLWVVGLEYTVVAGWFLWERVSNQKKVVTL